MYLQNNERILCVLRWFCIYHFTVNPAGIQDLLIQSVKLLSSSESHDRYEGRGGTSDEEDEGEIVSDDEEMQVDGSNPSVTIRYMYHFSLHNTSPSPSFNNCTSTTEVMRLCS